MEFARPIRAFKWTWSLPSNPTIVWGFIVFGILVRLRQYLFDRSLWLDESFLALNIIHRSAAGLLKPLDYNQAAPLGFLLLQKAAARYLGSGELVLRLRPIQARISFSVKNNLKKDLVAGASITKMITTLRNSRVWLHYNRLPRGRKSVEQIRRVATRQHGMCGVSREHFWVM